MEAHSPEEPRFLKKILLTFDLFQSYDPDDAGALRSLPLVPAGLTRDGSSSTLLHDAANIFIISHLSKLVSQTKVGLLELSSITNFNLFF